MTTDPKALDAIRNDPAIVIDVSERTLLISPPNRNVTQNEHVVSHPFFIGKRLPMAEYTCQRRGVQEKKKVEMTWICSVRPRLTPHHNHIGCSRFGFEPGHARLIGACLNFPRVCHSKQGCSRSNPNGIAKDGFQFCRRARLNDVRAPVRANIKQTKPVGYGPVDFSASAKPFR
jgi:hypothetical protein